jgi:hypothetical protein
MAFILSTFMNLHVYRCMLCGRKERFVHVLPLTMDAAVKNSFLFILSSSPYMLTSQTNSSSGSALLGIYSGSKFFVRGLTQVAGQYPASVAVLPIVFLLPS